MFAAHSRYEYDLELDIIVADLRRAASAFSTQRLLLLQCNGLAFAGNPAAKHFMDQFDQADKAELSCDAFIAAFNSNFRNATHEFCPGVSRDHGFSLLPLRNTVKQQTYSVY